MSEQPSMDGPKPPSPPSSVASAGVPDDLIELGDRIVNLQMIQLQMLLDYVAKEYGIHISVSNRHD